MFTRKDRRENILPLGNEAEARLLDALLTDQEIPHVIVSYHDSAYDGLFQSQQGWGHLEAPLEYMEEIRQVYRDMKEENPYLEDED